MHVQSCRFVHKPTVFFYVLVGRRRGQILRSSAYYYLINTKKYYLTQIATQHFKKHLPLSGVSDHDASADRGCGSSSDV